MNTTSKYVVLVVVIVLVLVGGWHYLKTTASESSAGSTTKTFSLEVKDRKVVGGDALFTAKQGDTVSITITANESDELHLHGYDKSVDFATGTPATLTFVADQSGRFPFEMEGSKTDLGELDVQP